MQAAATAWRQTARQRPRTAPRGGRAMADSSSGCSGMRYSSAVDVRALLHREYVWTNDEFTYLFKKKTWNGHGRRPPS
jgi:hypothetical protein